MLSHDAARPEGETIINATSGVVRCAHRRAAIIGAGVGRHDAPWEDASWCFFAINEIAQPLYHRHFDLHPMSAQSADELRWLAACRVPCYVLDLKDAGRELVPDERLHVTAQGTPRSFAGVANAVAYPLERVLAATGGRRYFTSTFAYQVALALADGFEEIGIWGVELYEGSARERTVELAGLEYWLGVATGRGVALTIGPRWLARRRHLYGYDYWAEAQRVGEDLAFLRTIIEPSTKD